jgi:hypothetical protein
VSDLFGGVWMGWVFSKWVVVGGSVCAVCVGGLNFRFKIRCVMVAVGWQLRKALVGVWPVCGGVVGWVCRGLGDLIFTEGL